MKIEINGEMLKKLLVLLAGPLFFGFLYVVVANRLFFTTFFAAAGLLILGMVFYKFSRERYFDTEDMVMSALIGGIGSCCLWLATLDWSSVYEA